MLDISTNNRLEELYEKYSPLYQEQPSSTREAAFNHVLECIGMILKEYENDCEEMVKWYEEQERRRENDGD